MPPDDTVPDPTPPPPPSPVPSDDLGLGSDTLAAIRQARADTQASVDSDDAERQAASAMTAAINGHDQAVQAEGEAQRKAATSKHAALNLFIRDLGITDVNVN